MCAPKQEAQGQALELKFGCYFLFDWRQIFIFFASFIRFSLKSGCAMLMIFSARIHVDKQ